MNILIDIINPSDALFFNSILNAFNSENINITVTVRNRAETIGLVKLFNINSKVVGRDYTGKVIKPINMIYRTIQLYLNSGKFDYSVSFENGMCTAVSKLKKKKSILYCDNDLKFLQKKSIYQDLETKVKSIADHIIIPKGCFETFANYLNKEKLIEYNGYKEDVYIADYKPDPQFTEKIPYKNFIVVRPEAFGSFYVKENKSIVPDLLKGFKKENINVVYLPREKEDFKHAEGFDIFIPNKPLNGLDLSYYANAILTGSGTMAREAACMGKTSVSFFPSEILLSVDKKLVEEKKMLYSRNVEEITNHIISAYNKKQKIDMTRCKKVKEEVIQKTKKILNER